MEPERTQHTLKDSYSYCFPIPMSVLLQQIESEGEEDPETILDGMPIPKELCSVRLWEVETNQSLLQASAHIDNMRALHFLPCSDKLGSLASTPDNILAHHYHAASQSSAGIFYWMRSRDSAKLSGEVLHGGR